jgi:hypothetical protein
LSSAAHDRRGGEYLCYRTTAGIRRLVKKRLLRPCGRGARGQHLFELSELDRYTRDRGLAYDARRVECPPKLGHSSPCREASGAPGGDEHHAPGEGDEAEQLRRVYRLSDGTFRIVAKAIDPKTGKPKFKERFTRELDPQMTQNAAIAYRTELINEIKIGTTGSGVPTEIPRLETLCRSSWITFVTENVGSADRAAKLGRVIETHVLRRWRDHFIDKINVPEIDAWVRSLTRTTGPRRSGIMSGCSGAS